MKHQTDMTHFMLFTAKNKMFNSMRNFLNAFDRNQKDCVFQAVDVAQHYSPHLACTKLWIERPEAKEEKTVSNSS